MKKVLLLFVLIISSIVSLYAITVDGLNYSLQGESAYVAKGNYRGDVVIPAAITYKGVRYKVSSIDKEAFSDCSQVVSVSIPNSVTYIGARAFSGCNSLKTINIPNQLSTIYEFTFSGCSSLDTITIPNSVKNIFSSAFEGCESLKNVTLPKSIEIFRNYVFDNCPELMNIYVEEGCETLKSVDGVLYTHSGTLVQYPAARSGSFSIPEGVTTIGRRAFGGCMRLEAVKTPGSLIKLDISAFQGCALTSIELVSGLKHIDDSAFEDCISLKEIRIPETVTTIGDYAFSGCNGLTDVDDCSERKSISQGCYRGCKSLNEVNIPSSVITINSSAFSGCSSLGSIIIPKSVTSIDYDVFRNCDQMISVTCRAITPPAIQSNTLYGDDTFDVILPYLYIPKGTLSSYRASEWSKYFKNIIEIEDQPGSVHQIYDNMDISISRSGQTVMFDGLEDDMPIAIYSLSGMQIYSGCSHKVDLPENGVYLLIYCGKQLKFII